MSGTQLPDREESTERFWALGAEKVLSTLPKAHVASGDKIAD
jgi:hypothetical protein